MTILADLQEKQLRERVYYSGGKRHLCRTSELRFVHRFVYPYKRVFWNRPRTRPYVTDSSTI
jgi:hypothetical protein